MTITVSDPFTDAGSSSDWSGASRTINTTNNTIDLTEDGICWYNTEVAASGDIWMAFTAPDAGASNNAGPVIGCDNTGAGFIIILAGGGSNLVVDFLAEYVSTTYQNNFTDENDDFGSAWNASNRIGVTIDYAATTIRMWNNVTAAEPTTTALWDGNGPQVSFNYNTRGFPAPGRYVGFGNWDTGTPNESFGSFTGGTIGAAGPSVTDVDTDEIVLDGQIGATVTGTNLGDTTSNRTIELRQGGLDVLQTQTGGNATSGTFNVVTQSVSGDLKYGATTFVLTRDDPIETTLAIQLEPRVGEIYANMGAQATEASNRITAIPDIAAGDQIHVRGYSEGPAPAGLVLNSDGTFYFSAGFTPQSFQVRVWDASDGFWSYFAMQYMDTAESVFEKPLRFPTVSKDAQLPTGASVDWTNPLTRDLHVLWNGADISREIISGAPLVIVNESGNNHNREIMPGGFKSVAGSTIGAPFNTLTYDIPTFTMERCTLFCIASKDNASGTAWQTAFALYDEAGVAAGDINYILYLGSTVGGVTTNPAAYTESPISNTQWADFAMAISVPYTISYVRDRTVGERGSWVIDGRPVASETVNSSAATSLSNHTVSRFAMVSNYTWNTEPLGGNVALVAVWNRQLSVGELTLLHRDPWQLFKRPEFILAPPKKRRLVML